MPRHDYVPPENRSVQWPALVSFPGPLGRFGAALMAFLVSVFLLVVAAELWMWLTPPPWASGACTLYVVAAILVVGWLGSLPSKVEQPRGARPLCFAVVLGAVCAPLVALSVVDPSSESAGLVMGLVALGEGALVIVVAIITARARRPGGLLPEDAGASDKLEQNPDQA
jgi:hypothetical protein